LSGLVFIALQAPPQETVVIKHGISADLY